MAQRLDPLTHLERHDKWYLGGGRSSCFAPPFPQHLETLGFWDEVHFAEIPIPRLFTAFLLDESGQTLPLKQTTSSWRPDRLRQTFENNPDLIVREEKVVLAEDVFASHITCSNRGEESREIDVLVWTIRKKSLTPSSEPSLSSVRFDEGQLRYVETFTSREDKEEVLHYCLGADQEPLSAAINLCEPTCGQPLWQVSTLPEKFHNGQLAGDEKLDVGAVPEGEVHMALHYRLTIPPHERRDITIACAVAAAHECACEIHETSLQVDVVATAVSQWREFFESVPHFSCSDPFLTRYYWHRWYGLRLCMNDPKLGFLTHPCVFEGIGRFRWFISYSAQCHMLECAWMHDPAFAKGSLLGMLENQMDSGQIRGHAGLFSRDEGFYHANWGANALQILALHPDPAFAATIYEPLARYANYFDRERDKENSGLYDVINQSETGQEYMSRYLAVDPEADKWGPFQLKGVDATVYLYELKRALATLAEQLGKPEEASQWQAEAEKTGKAILEHMWDAEDGMFYDCDPKTLKPTRCKAAVGFYPFLTDLCGPEHLRALKDHLLNPREFWLPCGPPSTSADDELYSSQAEWKGKRQSCPWNGRMWPMTSSHVCEAFAKAACEFDETLRPQAAEMIRRFIHTMFFAKDPQRPNCFEHYNPVTGEPAAYRGIDDYQHSWVNDLIIKYVAGLQPRPDNLLVVDPLDFNLQEFTLSDVPYKGHKIDITYGPVSPDRPPLLRVQVDGELKAEHEGLGRVEVPL
ncbi:MAG: MGH1-like glycoside hydrolase domain-containing protein [Armatimonadota bacterium]